MVDDDERPVCCPKVRRKIAQSLGVKPRNYYVGHNAYWVLEGALAMLVTFNKSIKNEGWGGAILVPNHLAPASL